MPSDRKLTIALSRGGSLKNLAGSTNKVVTWPELVDILSDCYRDNITFAEYLALSKLDQGVRKNRPGAFVGGAFSDGRRNSDSILFRSVVTVDIDSNCEDIWADICLTGGIPALQGLAYQIHTTRKHTDDAPRLRVCLPLSRDVTPEEYVPVMCAVAEMIDPLMQTVSSESFVAVQVMFLPSACKDSEFFSTAVEGDFLDPGPLLEKYPVDKPELWPSSDDGSIKPFSRLKITHPEDKKTQAPMITALHRAFDPRTFIETFLDDVYQPAGNRYLPVGASGAPSVRIYEDAFVQSDHGTDAARGQHNIFDLGRIHLFSHLDEDFDIEGMLPSEWPSYAAMCDWALKQDGVAEALAEVEAEVEAERNAQMVDMLGELDDDDEEDDLVGSSDESAADDKKEDKAPTIEDVLVKVRRSIGRAKSLDDLERRLEIIRGFPTTSFRDLHRDLVAGDVQKAFFELIGEKITKATARKMLAPTVENLRDQMAGEPLPDWLKDWVYVTSENRFLNLETKEELAKEGFNGRFNRDAGEQFGVTELGVARLSAFDVATQVFCLPMPYVTRYHPGRPTLFTEEGVFCANTYRSVMVETGGYKGKAGVKLLKRLLADMFPEKAHQQMVLDFMAHCVRHPEKKLRYALLIKGSENEGKSLLAKLMRELLGRRNFAIVGPDLLKEKFNGWAYEKLFCVVEEIKISGREAHDVLNKVKTIITNDEISIRRMQKDSTTEDNFCNMYLTTNFEDCLPLEEDNSRYLVLFTRFRTNQEVKDWRAARIKKEGEDYVRVLWDHIDQRPYQFLDFFSSYEFSEHYFTEGGRAPDTRFKKLMAEDGKSEERVLLEQMLQEGNVPGISEDILLWSSFRDQLDIRGLGTSLRGRGISSFLKPMGFLRARETSVSVDGSKRNLVVWTRNLEMLESGDKLTPTGLKLAAEALALTEDDDDNLASLVDNVVPIRKK